MTQKTIRVTVLVGLVLSGVAALMPATVDKYNVKYLAGSRSLSSEDTNHGRPFL